MIDFELIFVNDVRPQKHRDPSPVSWKLSLLYCISSSSLLKSGEHKCKHLFINPYFLFRGSLCRPCAPSHRVTVGVPWEEQSKSFQCCSFSELFQSFCLLHFQINFTVSLPISKKEKILLGSLQDFIDSLRQFRENCDLEGAEFSNPYSRNVFPIPQIFFNFSQQRFIVYNVQVFAFPLWIYS